MVVGESMLGERIELSMDRVVLLRDYPNSMYFRAFDATVQAGGYNSFHETRRFGLPALFYPNMNTGMDDQLARCKVAEDEGWGTVVAQRNGQSITNGIDVLLKMTPLKGKKTDGNGAIELSQKILMDGSATPKWARVEHSQLVHRINQRFLEENGYEMDWMNPTTFNHHIQLSKFELEKDISNLTDKIKVRDYVADRIGKEHLIPIIGTFDSIEDFDFEPHNEDIVIKTNHGSGPNHCEILPSIKSKEEIIDKFNRAISNPYYGIEWGEFQYVHIQPRLIVEQRIGGENRSPNDLKFHIFNSKSSTKWFLQVNSDRSTGLKANIFDENFKKIDVIYDGLPNGDIELPPIETLDSMLAIAKTLADGHRYVRVDLYLADSQIFFGELTFTPGCGFTEFSDFQISKKFGSYFSGGDLS